MKGKVRARIHAATIIIGLAVSSLAAQQTKAAPVARFTATAVNLARVGGETISIVIFRWSTDQERDQILAAFTENKPDSVGAVLQKLDTIGFIWRSGSGIGYSVRYASQAMLPGNRQRTVIATDRDLSEWNTPTSGPAVATPGAALSLIELRVPPAGIGEGKMSTSLKLASDTKILSLENYQAAPVVLKGVKVARQ